MRPAPTVCLGPESTQLLRDVDLRLHEAQQALAAVVAGEAMDDVERALIDTDDSFAAVVRCLATGAATVTTTSTTSVLSARCEEEWGARAPAGGGSARGDPGVRSGRVHFPAPSRPVPAAGFVPHRNDAPHVAVDAAVDDRLRELVPVGGWLCWWRAGRPCVFTCRGALSRCRRRVGRCVPVKVMSGRRSQSERRIGAPGRNQRSSPPHRLARSVGSTTAHTLRQWSRAPTDHKDAVTLAPPSTTRHRDHVQPLAMTPAISGVVAVGRWGEHTVDVAECGGAGMTGGAFFWWYFA